MEELRLILILIAAVFVGLYGYITIHDIIDVFLEDRKNKK